MIKNNRYHLLYLSDEDDDVNHLLKPKNNEILNNNIVNKNNEINNNIINIDTANIDTANIDTSNIDTANIDTVNIDTVNINTANINTVNIDNDNKNTYDNIEDYKEILNESIMEEKEFIDPILLNNINLYYYFDKNDIAYVEKYKKTHLKITDKGLYSISKPLDAQWITEQIIKEYNNLKINNIIDGTAGVGGNVISFAKHFKNVIGIELNKVHYNVLKDNINLLDLKNVRLYNDNILTYYEHIQERDKNIFFIDPPWGGRKYKNFKNFVLKIGKYYIYEFIEMLYKSGFKQIVLKAPLNLNVNLIVQNISFKNIKVIKHVNMMLLMIS